MCKALQRGCTPTGVHTCGDRPLCLPATLVPHKQSADDLQRLALAAGGGVKV